MGGRVTLRCITIGWRQHVNPSASAFLLVELFKASESFVTITVNQTRAAYLGEKSVDWPIILSVLSRGIVLMISLDKRLSSFFFFLLPVCAATHQQSWQRHSTRNRVYLILFDQFLR